MRLDIKVIYDVNSIECNVSRSQFDCHIFNIFE